MTNTVATLTLVSERIEGITDRKWCGLGALGVENRGDLLRELLAHDHDVSLEAPTRGWLPALDPFVGLWIGKRVDITAAHTPEWSARLLGICERELYLEEQGGNRWHASRYQLQVRLHDDRT